MTVLRACYKAGSRFDESYYMSQHLPLVRSILGAVVKNIEVVKINALADGSAPPYQVMFSAYFDSTSALQTALQHPRVAEILDDIKNFYDGTPEIMVGDVSALSSRA